MSDRVSERWLVALVILMTLIPVGVVIDLARAGAL